MLKAARDGHTPNMSDAVDIVNSGVAMLKAVMAKADLRHRLAWRMRLSAEEKLIERSLDVVCLVKAMHEACEAIEDILKDK